MSAQLSADKPTIKILIYTDDPEVSPTEDISVFFGLGSMLARLKAHEPAFATIKPTLVNRRSVLLQPADNKINDVLKREVDNTGEPFDEIWFFGIQQANTEKPSQAGVPGGPDSELDEDEVKALTEWMDAEISVGGGVLMTGDHSSALPPKRVFNADAPCKDNSADATLLGLGRAIGRCVPRAGMLRKWEGLPTSNSNESNNTIVGAAGLQSDPRPQVLRLEKVDANGDPDPNGDHHPLFFYGEDQFIQVFPDHAHEGELIIPQDIDFNDNVWRKIKPHAVAFSTNNRNNESLNAIATYNGDRASLGRIVADSTWHHYMNLNLLGFPHPAPAGSDSDQIGQFYANLAVWLAPLKKRQQMAQSLYWKLARFTYLVEPKTDAASLGQTASSILSRVASRCEIHELLNVFAPEEHIALNAARAELGISPQTTHAMALGNVLTSYHDAMTRAEMADDPNEVAPMEPATLINAAFTTTLETQKNTLQSTLDLMGGAGNPKA